MKTQIITDDVFFIDIIRYCEKNGISDIDNFTAKCLKSGFYIEKYGMLGDNTNLNTNTIEVVKEVEKIVEVPVDRIVEVPVDRVIEKIVEVVKEVPIYKEIIKEVETGGVRVEIKEIEVIKEVPVIQEVFVIREVQVGNMECENELSNLKTTFNSMNEELIKKNRIIEDYRKLFSDMTNQSARYHNSSNIKIR